MAEMPFFAMSLSFARPVFAQHWAFLESEAKIFHDADGYEAPRRLFDGCLLRRLSLAEPTTVGADFGRKSSLGAAKETEWQLLYWSDAAPTAQAAALYAVAPYQTSSVGSDAVSGLEAEQALN